MGELQSFLRMKMVEKLSETSLSPTLASGPLTSREHALNLIIFEFLKQRQMHYTLSVFASECASIRQSPNIDGAQVSKQIVEILNIRNMVNSHAYQKGKGGNFTVLDILVDECTSICGKTYASKSSQNLDNQFQKLMIHTEAQTHEEKTLVVIPTNSITTQTQLSVEDSDNTSSVKALNEEILQLRRQLDETVSALAACQRQLQETKEKTSQLMAIKLHSELPRSTDLKAVQLPSPVTLYSPNYLFDSLTTRPEDIYFERRIQEARQFLTGLDYRMDNLDRKYQRITAEPKLVRQDDDFASEEKMSDS